MRTAHASVHCPTAQGTLKNSRPSQLGPWNSCEKSGAHPLNIGGLIKGEEVANRDIGVTVKYDESVMTGTLNYSPT